MIIRKKNILEKSSRVLAITFLMIIIVICLLSIICCVAINNTEIQDYTQKVIISSISSLVLSISIGDLISLIKNYKSISLWLVKRLRKKHHKEPSQLLAPWQSQFIEHFYGLQKKSGCICLIGQKLTGKSIAIYELLNHLCENIRDKSELNLLYNLTIINCSSDKENIVEFLSQNPYQRIQDFANNLVIIDNIEKMGAVFFEENKPLFNSGKSLFIVIEDVASQDSILKKNAIAGGLLFEFNNKLQYSGNNDLSELDGITRDVLITICILTQFGDLIRVKDIFEILSIYSKRNIKSSLKSLEEKGFVTRFLIDTNFIYKIKNINIEKLQLELSSQFSINHILKSTKLSYLQKWGCMLGLNLDSIRYMNAKEKRDIFEHAPTYGDYENMYNLLCSLTYDKQNEFLYERAILAFHVGHHVESASLYSKLMVSAPESNRKQMMLGIIESTHGNCDPQNIENLQNYLKALKADQDYYSVCAKYWEAHIGAERGQVDHNAFTELIEQLSPYADIATCKEIIQRCYTDAIRCCYISGNCNIVNLFENFETYLYTFPETHKTYYRYLYILAGKLHYLTIPNAILEQEDNIDGLVNTACYYYNYVRRIGYGDKKSVLAAEIKNIDLMLMYSDTSQEKYDHYKRKILDFKQHAAVNNVSVHVAFSDTLLMKLCMLNPSNISNAAGIELQDDVWDEVNRSFTSAKEIYVEYGNTYGVFRLNFLYLLFKLLSCRQQEEFNNIILTLQALCEPYSFLYRESKIIHILINKQCIPKQQILSFIRAYPVILQ